MNVAEGCFNVVVSAQPIIIIIFPLCPHFLSSEENRHEDSGRKSPPFLKVGESRYRFLHIFFFYRSVKLPKLSKTNLSHPSLKR